MKLETARLELTGRMVADLRIAGNFTDLSEELMTDITFKSIELRRRFETIGLGITNHSLYNEKYRTRKENSKLHNALLRAYRRGSPSDSFMVFLNTATS